MNVEKKIPKRDRHFYYIHAERASRCNLYFTQKKYITKRHWKACRAGRGMTLLKNF